MIKVRKNSKNKSIFRSPESFWTSPEIFGNILRNFFDYCPDSFRTFPGIFLKILRNLLERSPESFRTFHYILSNSPRNLLAIPQNLLKSFPEFSWTFPWTFPGMLKWKHFLEYSKIFPGILVSESQFKLDPILHMYDKKECLA